MDISYTVRTQVQRTILEHNLIREGEHIGIGVSGGMDSMALLHILMSIRDIRRSFDISVLHFEHGIRGQESIEDMDFVIRYCRDHDIPCYTERSDVPSYAITEDMNLENAARKLRYAFFEKCMHEHDIDRIAVAHHMNDNAETFLFNLVRGAGTRGLRQMDHLSGHIIRPLLDISRKDIESYVSENNIPYREDSSNNDTNYTRNYIRKVIIPAMEKINGNAVAQINRSSVLLSEEHDYIASQASEIYLKTARVTDHQISFELSSLSPYHDAIVKELLIRAVYNLSPGLRDLTEDHVAKLLGFVRQKRANVSYMLPQGITAYTTYDLLIITDKMYKIDEVQPIAVTDGFAKGNGFVFEAKSSSIPDVYPDKQSLIQFIDGDKLPSGTVIRNRQEGDVFSPFSLGGSQKLKKWFINNKFSSEDRAKQLLLCHGHDVLWIIGHALSDELRIDNDTKNILMLTFSYTDRDDYEELNEK